MSDTANAVRPTDPAASPAALPPLRLAVAVPLAPAAAFRLFTAGMTEWWPLGQFSVGQERARRVVFDERLGGRVYEVADDGTEHDWGRVLAWEPAARFVMTWHPGRDPAGAQELELRFVADGPGTRVELEHRGWERLREAAAESRQGYDEGWKLVVGGAFRDAALVAAG